MEMLSNVHEEASFGCCGPYFDFESEMKTCSARTNAGKKFETPDTENSNILNRAKILGRESKAILWDH